MKEFCFFITAVFICSLNQIPQKCPSQMINQRTKKPENIELIKSEKKNNKDVHKISYNTSIIKCNNVVLNNYKLLHK